MAYGYIYMIENIINEKRYIGQTVDINKRMNRHKENARNGVKGILYNAIRKYGEENFVYYIIDEAESKEELDDLEKYYIELYDTFKGYGYNASIGGNGFVKGEDHPFYGKHHTDETKKRIGEAHRNKEVSEETRKKLSKAKEGKVKGESNPNSKLTEEDVLKIIDLLNSKEYKQQEIADMFNVSQLAITKIKCGRTWKHLHYLIR